MTDSWRSSAACRSHPPALFFDAATIPTAIVICRHCPVKADCAAYAADNDITEGVWGGALQGIVHGTDSGYQKGCRCSDCIDHRYAIRERHRLRMKAARASMTDTERAEWAATRIRRSEGAA